MNGPLGLSALLPQVVCRRHQLPAQLERSFRLETTVGLLPHRYILGTPARLIAPSCLEQVVDELGMPVTNDWVRAVLYPQLQKASTMYLGYEHGPDGDSHRLYFEFWDAVVHRLRSTPSTEIALWSGGQGVRPLWEMGIGHKWQTGTSLYSTLYRVQPLLPQEAIREKACDVLTSVAMPTDLASLVLSLINQILRQAPTIDPIFLEVVEPDSPRLSFDLCVHRLGLTFADLQAWLNPIVHWFLGEDSCLNDCVHSDGWNGYVTHVSAGCSRRGQPYCSVYYDLGPGDSGY